jgi:hypothetical protein
VTCSLDVWREAYFNGRNDGLEKFYTGSLFYARKRNPKAFPVNLTPMILRASTTKAGVFM